MRTPTLWTAHHGALPARPRRGGDRQPEAPHVAAGRAGGGQVSTLAHGRQGWESQSRGPEGACLCADHCRQCLESCRRQVCPAGSSWDPSGHSLSPASWLALRVLVLRAEFSLHLLPPPSLGSSAPVSGGPCCPSPTLRGHSLCPAQTLGVDSTLSPGPAPSSSCWREGSGASPETSPHSGGSREAVEPADVSGSNL